MTKIAACIVVFGVTIVVMLLAVSCSQKTFVSWPAPVLGVVVDADMQVLHVESGSAAEQAGIQTDDILVTFNGLALPKHREQLRESLVLDQAETAEIEMVLTRNGQLVTVMVIPSAMVPQNATRTATPVLAPHDYL